MLFANVGVPMIVVELPVMALALIPIVLLEAVIYVRLSHTTWSLAWRGSWWANVASTFVGIPVAWFVQVVVQMLIGGGSAWGIESPGDRLAAVTLQSAWLVPYEKDLSWMIPAAAIVLLVPCLLISIFVERFVLLRYWPESIYAGLTRNIIVANLISYLLVGAFWGIQLYLALSKRDLA